MQQMSSTKIDLKKLFQLPGNPKLAFALDVGSITHCCIDERNAIGFNRQDEIIRTFRINMGRDHYYAFYDTPENETSYNELCMFLKDSHVYGTMQAAEQRGRVLSFEETDRKQHIAQSLDIFWAKYGAYNRPQIS